MRKVKLAVLHANLQVPGIGEFGKTINTQDSQYKFRGVELTWNGQGLEVSHKGRTVFIPAPSVHFMEFAAPEKFAAEDKTEALSVA